MIYKVKIQNFKSIKELTLELDNINMLVGGNNSGKTSILQAIQFAISICQTTRLIGVRWIGDKLSSSLSSEQLLYTPIPDIYALGYGGNLKQDIGKSISIVFYKKKTDGNDDAFTEVRISRGKNKNISVQIVGKELGLALQDIENPFSIFVPGLAGIASQEEYKNPGLLRRAVARGDANNYFRNVLWQLRSSDEKSWTELKNKLSEIFPQITVDVHFDKDRDDKILANLMIGKNFVPIDSIGTGVLQSLQILSYIYAYRPQILIIDEPDAHLHPSNQRKLAQILHNLANSVDGYSTQIIISTHSRHILDELDQKAKIFWLSNGTLEPEDKTNLAKILMDLGALDKGDKLKSGKIKCVLLTEDSDTRYVEMVVKASNFKMSEVDVWSYSGCTNIQTALTLATFVNEHAPGTFVVLHRDRDYMTEDEANNYRKSLQTSVDDKKKQGARKPHEILCFFTQGTDIESYFLNAEHLHSLYPTITTEEAQKIIIEATEMREEDSIGKFVNTRTSAEIKQKGAGNLNVAKLYPAIVQAYTDDKQRFRHGKSVAAGVNSILAGLKIHQGNVLQYSSYLKDDELVKLARKIWWNAD